MRYRINAITHSGRKGVRGTPVTAEKYNGMVGSMIRMDNIENLRAFQSCRWIFIKSDSPYEWWNTSNVIGVTFHDDKYYTLETINTIYELELLS